MKGELTSLAVCSWEECGNTSILPGFKAVKMTHEYKGRRLQEVTMGWLYLSGPWDQESNRKYRENDCQWNTLEIPLDFWRHTHTKKLPSEPCCESGQSTMQQHFAKHSMSLHGANSLMFSNLIQ